MRLDSEQGLHMGRLWQLVAPNSDCYLTLLVWSPVVHWEPQPFHLNIIRDGDKIAEATTTDRL